MAKLRKVTSLFLSLALLLTSVFACSMVILSDGAELFSSVNTYDDEGISFNSYDDLDGHLASSISTADGEVRYGDKPLYFSAYGAQVQPVPEEVGASQGNAVHFVEAASSAVYYFPIVRVYKDDDAKLAHFAPKANTSYELRLKYYVAEAPSKEIQLQVRRSAWEELDYYKSNSDIGSEVVVCSITDVTDGWAEATVTFTTAESPQYMSIGLVSSTPGAASNVDVWMDDVQINECSHITAYNYDTVADKAIPVSELTTISDIEIPEVAGYRFCGVFADAEYKSKLDSSDMVSVYTALYFKWEPTVLGEYYCGFEDYIPQSIAASYDPSVIAITGEATYIGKSALKATLSANGITAFELRADDAFEISAGNEYRVSFAYKAESEVEIYAGLAKAADVPGTAYAISGVEAAADDGWQTVALTLNADKGTTDGYAIAMLIYSAGGGSVYIDDVLVSGHNVAMVNPTINTDFTPDWYPNLAVFEGIEVPEIWDGSVATSFASGTGTEEDPYMISNGAELAYAITSGGLYETTEDEEGNLIPDSDTLKYFKLSDDIYLNDLNSINWQTGETSADDYNLWYRSVGWNWSEPGTLLSSSFAGTIDGDGHTVYGLYYYSDSTDYVNTSLGVALIPKTSGATTIKNLGIDNAYIKCSFNVSAFVASSQHELTIDKCFVGENVSLDGYYAAAFRAQSGSKQTTITNCYSMAQLNAKGLYGLVSAWSPMTLTNLYNANGPVWSQSDSGEYSSSVKFSNCYESITVGIDDAAVLVDNKANMQGEDVFTNSLKMPALNSADAFTATETYPVLSIFAEQTAAGDTETDPVIWSGDIATSFTGGTGTEADPYLISSGSELAYAITSGGLYETTEDQDGNVIIDTATLKHFKLTEDIYLNNINKVNWVSGTAESDYSVNSWYTSFEVRHNAANTLYKTFAGTIDGDGHTVYGLYINDPASYTGSPNWAAGLIPDASGATVIKNLGVDYSYLDYVGQASAFVGTSNSGASVTLDSCFVGNNVLLSGKNAAAFRSATNNCSVPITLTNCYSLATLVSHGGTYGLISSAWGTTIIKNSYNANGPITSSGEYITTVENCYQTAESGRTYSGAVTISAENMKGEDVLTSSDKMSLLNTDGAYVSTSLDFSEHDWYIYLPEGTVLEEDFEPSFFDTFFMSLEKEDVLVGNMMKRGAYVKFNILPVADKILIPESSADIVHQGAMLDIQNSELYYSTYYGIDMEIITKQLSNQPDDAVNYIFITDTHYGNGWNTKQDAVLVKQMKLIAETAKSNADIDFVVVGGDITNGAFNSKETHIGAMQKILNTLAECGKPVFVLMGNHDDGAWGTQFSKDYMISDKEWKDNILALYSPDTIQHDSQDTNSKYYYYDLEKGGKTTRIICLDSIDYDHKYDEETGAITELVVREGYESYADTSADKWLNGWTYWGYSPAQLQWLASVLSEEDKFDDVIFLSHMGIDETTYPNPWTIHYSAEMRALISAYQQKTSYTNPDMGIDVDYSDTTGKILSYQFGHTHMELTLYSEDVDIWQINTSTSNKEQNTADPTKVYKQDWNVLSQQLGNDSEACFDVMSVTGSEILKLNIGAGNSAKLITPADLAGDVNMDSVINICDLVKLCNGSSAKATAVDVDKNSILETEADAAALRKILID